MLIDAEFADRIINKYTAFGTYQLDEAHLVFLKEERQIQPVFAPARKLLFQLYMNWQNYSRSGQKLSVNWNMLERTISGNLREEIRVQSGKAVKIEAERILKTSLQKETEQYLQNSFQKETVRYLQNSIQTETEQYLKKSLKEETKQTVKSWSKEEEVQIIQSSLKGETKQFIKNGVKEKAVQIFQNSLQQEVKQVFSVNLNRAHKQALLSALQEEMEQILQRGLQNERNYPGGMKLSEVTQQIIQSTLKQKTEYSFCRDLPEIMTQILQSSMKEVDKFAESQYLTDETFRNTYGINQKNITQKLHIRLGNDESQVILKKQSIDPHFFSIEPGTVQISLGKRISRELKESLWTVTLEKMLSGKDADITEQTFGRFREELVYRLYVNLERTAGQELRHSIRDEAIRQIQTDLAENRRGILNDDVQQFPKEMADFRSQAVHTPYDKPAADLLKQRQRQQERKREFEKKLGESRGRQTFGKTSAEIAERITRTLQHRMNKETLWTRDGRGKKENDRYQNRKPQKEVNLNQRGAAQKEILRRQNRSSEEQKQRSRNRMLEKQRQHSQDRTLEENRQRTRIKRIETEQSLYHKAAEEKYRYQNDLTENRTVLTKNHVAVSEGIESIQTSGINPWRIEQFKLETLQGIVLSEKFDNYNIYLNREILQNLQSVKSIKLIEHSQGTESLVTIKGLKGIENLQCTQNFQMIHSKNETILRSVTGFEKLILEEMISTREWPANGSNFYPDYQIVKLNKYQVRLLNSISLLNILNLSKFQNERKQPQSAFATSILHKKSNRAGMFSYITTIFKDRGQKPDEVKKAEKKLVEILIKDISVQSTKLREKEERENRIFIARQAVMELLKETESRTAIRTAILGTDIRQQELIYHVRLMMGDQAAEQLKKYFFTRNQITGQAVNDQMGRLKQDYEKDAALSFLSALQKEQTLKSIRPNGYIQLENIIREKVHVPSAQNLVERKIRLEHIVRMMSKDYGQIVQRNLLARQIQKAVRYQATEEMLLPAVLPKLQTERRPLAILKDLRYHKNADFKLSVSSLKQENSIYRHTGTIIYRDSESDRSKKRNEEKANSLYTTMQYDEQKQILKKQSSQEEELRQTKQLLGTLNERMEMQDVVLKELKKTSVDGEKLPSQNVNQIAKEVLKKMEQDMRLERLRRGL